jgi:hypothetical protein
LAAILHCIAARWQQSLPALAITGAGVWLALLAGLGIVAWLAVFRADPTSERALFAALLVIYLLHQIEEHLWPGGFRHFANARVFKSGRDDWPVDVDGVALVNIGYVWLPIGAAVLFPEALRWVGLGWVGLTLVNGLSHIATSIRFRCYNPGLITSIVLFLPFTLWMLVHGARNGAYSAGEIAMIVLAGVLLHIPVGALFVMPFVRRRAPAA